MSSNRAIISLQLGNYSNYVGAHFWNMQEAGFVYPSAVAANTLPSEINHDALYREGETLNRQTTFTPRLVAVDLKGSLGLLPELGDLYDVTGSRVPKAGSLLWDGATEVRKEEPRRKNDFQKELDAEENVAADEDKDVCEEEVGEEGNPDAKRAASVGGSLDGQVQFWSDFLRARYHPRTNVLLREYQQGNSLRPFDVFGLGRTTWQDEDAGEDIEDRIRLLAEEADTIEGFHLLVDADGGFGGLAAGALESLADNYPGKCTLAFPLLPCHYDSHSPGANGARFLNQVLTIHAASASSSAAGLTTPLSLGPDSFPLPNNHRLLPHLCYRPELAYHTSAILAACLDTLSLPWRKKDTCNAVRLYDIAGGISSGGRRVAEASLAFPFPIGQEQYLVDLLSTDVSALVATTTPLTPHASLDGTPAFRTRAVSCRGLSSNRLMPANFGKVEGQADSLYSGCRTVAEALELYFSADAPGTATGVSASTVRLPVGRPFPLIFGPTVGPDGFLSSGSRVVRGNQVSTVAALTSWSASSTGAGAYSQALVGRARRVSLARMHRFLEAGLEQDEYLEVLEDLESLADNYGERHLT